MFGQSTHAAINEPLNAAFARRTPLVAVHRGTGLGSIAENTGPAVAAALAQGAEMVEIDVVESTDGDFFLFHDGYEAMHFGIAENIRTLSTAQILELAYKWCSHPGEPLRVAGVEEVLRAHPRTLFNVDRSWGSWPRLLPFLDRLLAADPATLKLLRMDPFDGAAPLLVRARMYDYRFTTRRERRATGNWWVRELLGVLVAPRGRA